MDCDETGLSGKPLHTRTHTHKHTVTLKVGCGIEVTNVVGTAGLLLPNGTRPTNDLNDPYLSTGQVGFKNMF
jgi:hypothetical protein